MKARRDELAATIGRKLDGVQGHLDYSPAVQDYEVADAVLRYLENTEVEQEEMTVYGYCVIGSDGESCLGTDVLSQQDAIDRAAEWSKDAKNLDIGYSYRVAAIVDQGGL